MLVHLITGHVYLGIFVICDLSGLASCLRAVADLLLFNPGSSLHPSNFGGHTIPSSSKTLFFCHVSKKKEKKNL